MKFSPTEIRRIVKLRNRGLSIARVADELGYPKNTIRTFCARHGLGRKGLTTFVFTLDDEPKEPRGGGRNE